MFKLIKLSLNIKKKHLLLIGLSVFFLFCNSVIYAEEPDEILQSPVDKLDARIKYRFIGDKIPVYSHNQCVIGNCSPYSIPKLEKTPEEKRVKKKIKPLKPIEIPDFIKSKEFKVKEIKKKIDEYNYENIDTSIIVLRINDTLTYDVEVIIWPNGSVSLPVKTLADFVEIPVNINHVNNNISFSQPLTDKNVIINPNESNVLVGTNFIEVKKPKIVYLKQGFLLEDEVFIPEELARFLLGIKTKFLEESYALDLKTQKVLKAIIKLNEQENVEVQEYKEQVDFVDKTEKENKTFKVKNISYSLGSTTSHVSSSDQSSTNQNLNASILSKGNLLGGEYNLGTNAYYTKEGMELGGYIASLNYVKNQKELSIGSTNSRLSDLAVPGTSIVGVRYGTLGASRDFAVLPRYITGRAEDNTTVELFINDIYIDKQKVQNGVYEFDVINYPHGSFVKVKIEQLGADNTRKIIYEDEFSQDSDLLAPGQKEYLVFSGVDNSITRQKLRLFGNGQNNNYNNPLKGIIGAKYRKGITSRLTAGTNIAHSTNLTGGNYIPSAGISDYPRIFRQNTFASGSVASIDMDYAHTENLKFSSEIGVSNASSKSLLEPNSTDIGSFVGFKYDKPQGNLSGKLFSYGSDFYSGGYGDTIDKRGVELYGSYNIDSVNFSGNLIRYNSNLDNLFGGGLSTITDSTFSISGPVDENTSMRIGARSSIASNSLYSNNQLNLNLNMNTRLSDKTNLILDYIKTINQNDNYLVGSENKMTNNRFNAELIMDMDELGKMRLSHEIMVLTPQQQLIMGGVSSSSYKPPIYKNIYLKLDRSNQPIKGFTFSPNIGYRYGGKNKGLLLGTQITYEFTPGHQIMLTYSYNSVFSNQLNGVSFGGNSSHTLSLNLINTLNLGIGDYPVNHSPFPYNPDNGIIKGFVYLDLNQNGFKDLDEKGVGYIDVTVKNMYTVTTDEYGYYIAPNLHDRIYYIGINKNSLPVIYSPTTNDIAVRVKGSKIYVANHGLIVTPGSISGKVKIKKEGVPVSEVIILLLDKDGKEVKYTTTDSIGGYYLGSVPPGDYYVVVDTNYLDYNGLQIKQEEKCQVNIPLILDDFVEINDINFELIPKQANVVNF